jgi:hypothetical protein
MMIIYIVCLSDLTQRQSRSSLQMKLQYSVAYDGLQPASGSSPMDGHTPPKTLLKYLI